MDEEPIPVNLQDYIGKVVHLGNGERGLFGILQTDGNVFAVNGNVFQTGMVKELTKVEVEESRNLCRLGIKI